MKNIGDQENKAAKENALTNVASAKEQVQLKIVDVVYQVILSYWRLQLETNLNDVHRGNLQLAEDIWKQEQERYILGISRQIDVDRAVSAIETRRNRLLRSINRRKTVFHQLRYLVNAPQIFSEFDQIEIIPTEQPITTLPNLTVPSLLDEAFQMPADFVRLVNNQRCCHLWLKGIHGQREWSWNPRADGDLATHIFLQ